MACLAEKSIIKSKEAIKYARSLELDSLQTQIIRLEGELTRKKEEWQSLENQIDTLTIQLGKTRDDIKKTRKSLSGVIGGFGGMVGLILVVIGVIWYIKRRKSSPTEKPVDTWTMPVFTPSNDEPNVEPNTETKSTAISIPKLNMSNIGGTMENTGNIGRDIKRRIAQYELNRFG
ncbi:hypothetical protein EOVG_00037 [Emiliania huxleyi virus 88]|nr:hypothetical protein EOVG_00037 [Emiliania huxleyi virus 88]